MKRLNGIRSHFSALLLVGLVIGLQGCGGGGGGTPPPGITTDQDGSGIYTGTATVDVNTPITDLKGIVYNNRIMFFSATASPHVLYDGTITSVTNDDYTATVNVYENGVLTADKTGIAVTGKVLTANKITGTLGTAGTAGNHNGTFSLTYDSIYERGATLARIDADGLNQATGQTYGTLDLSGEYLFNSSFSFGFLGTGSSTCQIGDVYSIPDAAVNVYAINNIDIVDPSTTCQDSYEGTGYSGLITVVDDSVDGADSRIVIAYTNGTNSVFGIVNK